VIVLPFTQANP